MTRIGILGIGAVGGYFGGLLAEKYHDTDTEVIFIASKRSATTIRTHGLRLKLLSGERTVRPHLVVSAGESVPQLDYLICAVKSYDLEESIRSLNGGTTAGTTILPLLNGVDASARIRKLLPHANVIDGCVYLMCRLTEPGVVEQLGKIDEIYYGASNGGNKDLSGFNELLKAAGIKAHLTDSILETCWEKFIFITGLANLTCYYNKPIGEILRDHNTVLDNLLAEVNMIAIANGIKLKPDILQTTKARMQKLPFTGTSSMHSDLKAGKKFEYRSLTEYLMRLGETFSLETPVLNEMYRMLKSKYETAVL
jgi:2-dehydropantoate 2-reductase